MRKIGVIITCLMFCLSLAAGAMAATYQNKKVLFIDSYHEGYDWSDGITRGVKSVIEAKGATLKIARMDTKRKKSEDAIKASALEMKALIEEFKPDVVIASDDNAAKYLIAPYYKDGKLPFVFCGVNWDATGYGFPCSNVTGMVEVNDVVGLVEQLKGLAKGQRIGFIAGDTLTNRKEVENYKKAFNLDVTPYYATDFADWKKGFVEIQQQVDLLIVYNYVAVEGWNKDEAAEFARTNTRVPTGTMQEGPMDYALLGFLKVPEEQGSWAAETALKIMDGASPQSIQVARNTQGRLMLNMKIAQGMGAELPYQLIEAADGVIE